MSSESGILVYPVCTTYKLRAHIGQIPPESNRAQTRAYGTERWCDFGAYGNRDSIRQHDQVGESVFNPGCTRLGAKNDHVNIYGSYILVPAQD